MSNAKTGKAIDLKLLLRVLKFARPYRNVLFLSIFFSILLSLLGPVRPLLINYAVDHHIIGFQNIDGKQCSDDDIVSLLGISHDPCDSDIEKLGSVILILISLLLLESIIQFLYIYLSTWIGQHVIKDLRSEVYQHILKLRMKFFDNTPIGSLVTRTISDIETISDIFSQGLFVIIGELLRLFVIVLVMFYINWKLALISMISIPILLVATAWFKRNIKSAFQNIRREVSNINTFVQEHLVGMSVVQIFNREDSEYRQFQDINNNHLDANLKSVFYYSVFFPIVEILSALSVGAVVWYGGLSILSHQGVTQGEIFAFILYIYMMFRPIRQLADRFNILQMGIVGSERVFKILDTKEFIQDSGKVKNIDIKGRVEYKNVDFAYKDDDWVLRDISFTIDQGKKLALVGKTGSGKTSIINILNRFYEFQHGEIIIDNIHIHDFQLSYLRENIAVVQQEVHLFSSSIIDNVILFDKNISYDDVINAAKEIGVHDFIMSLPGGYQYIVGERGITLSTGQRQLISFLRVFLRNPRILILDEATSSIDSHTESILQIALNKISEGRTTIVIAHRLSTIINSDKILLLEDGNILEEGTHHELINQDSKYKQMYDSQFSKHEGSE